VRLAARLHRRLRRAACAGLFAALVDELADAGRLRGFVTGGIGTGGIGTGKLARLLRRAGNWLDAEHGLRLEFRRPFRKGGGRDPGACLRLLAEHLARAGTAAIVGTADHWTAVSAVSGKRLLLADSHDQRYFLLAKALGTDAATSRLHLSSTFLLRIVPPPDAST